MILLFALLACGDPPPADVCHLDGLGCNECFSGYYSCSYDGVEVTETGCNGPCKIYLYQELCARGYTDSLETVDQGMVCVEVDEPE